MSPAEACSRGVWFKRGHPPTRHPSPRRSLRPLPVVKAKLWTSLRRLAATFAFAPLRPNGNEEPPPSPPFQDVSHSRVKFRNKGQHLATEPTEQRYLLPAASGLWVFPLPPPVTDPHHCSVSSHS